MGVIATIVTEMISGIFDIFHALLSILPESPFSQMLDKLTGIDFLPYLNWVIPFDNAVIFMGIWLTAYTLYLVYVYGIEIFNKIKM